MQCIFVAFFPIRFCTVKDQASTCPEKMPHMEGVLVFKSTLEFEVFSLIFRSVDNAELCFCGLQTLLLWTGRCSGWLPR